MDLFMRICLKNFFRFLEALLIGSVVIIVFYMFKGYSFGFWYVFWAYFLPASIINTLSMILFGPWLEQYRHFTRLGYSREGAKKMTLDYKFSPPLSVINIIEPIVIKYKLGSHWKCKSKIIQKSIQQEES